MAHLANVRIPEAKSKKQARAMFAHTDRARVADITSRYDGKPCRASDFDGARETDTVQIRYASDRKVTVTISVPTNSPPTSSRHTLPPYPDHW